jgi:hypothetical protein
VNSHPRAFPFELKIVKSGNQHEWSFRMQGRDVAKKIKAGFSRHFEIRDDRIISGTFKIIASLFCTYDQIKLEAGCFQIFAYQAQKVLVIINYQNFCYRFSSFRCYPQFRWTSWGWQQSRGLAWKYVGAFGNPI